MFDHAYSNCSVSGCSSVATAARPLSSGPFFRSLKAFGRGIYIISSGIASVMINLALHFLGYVTIMLLGLLSIIIRFINALLVLGTVAFAAGWGLLAFVAHDHNTAAVSFWFYCYMAMSVGCFVLQVIIAGISGSIQRGLASLGRSGNGGNGAS